MRRQIVVLLALRSEPTMRANHRCGSALCASKPRRQRPRVDLQHMARPEQHSRPGGHRLRQQSRRFCRCKSKAWASNTYPELGFYVDPRMRSMNIDPHAWSVACARVILACGHGAQCSGRFERSWSVQDKTYDATFHLRRHAVSTTRTHTDTSPLPRCHLHDLLSQCTPSLHQN